VETSAEVRYSVEAFNRTNCWIERQASQNPNTELTRSRRAHKTFRGPGRGVTLVSKTARQTDRSRSHGAGTGGATSLHKVSFCRGVRIPYGPSLTSLELRDGHQQQARVGVVSRGQRRAHPLTSGEGPLIAWPSPDSPQDQRAGAPERAETRGVILFGRPKRPVQQPGYLSGGRQPPGAAAHHWD